MMLVMGVHMFVYASGSITSGGAFTAIASCIVVMGKVFTVSFIVEIVIVVSFAFTTTKTSVDCLITLLGGTNRQVGCEWRLRRCACSPVRAVPNDRICVITVSERQSGDQP